MATQQTLLGVGGGAQLYDFGSSATFTAYNNNKYGPSGVSLSEARSGLSGGNSGTWKNDTNWFNTSSGYQLWTVPKTGTYRIRTDGVRGGQEFSSYQGGYGVKMEGEFNLTAGDIIKMLVGQTGGSSYGGGGGMTAVATYSNTPLIVSGSGNCHSSWNSTSRDATTSESSVTSSAGYNASGGGGGYSSAGVWGGAGFYGNPTNQPSCNYTRPNSFTNGGQGGQTCNGYGGFGGGSATDGCCYGASGAGAGYSGGGGTSGSGQYGGAGGSYNSGSNQSNGGQTTYGRVIITML
tara:strand:+ start:1066 stop:1941 length:876 start_codon:yes stop_codon:yes gene_type:complete